MTRDERTRLRSLFLSERNEYPPAEAARLTDTDLAELTEEIETGRIAAEKCYLLARRDVLRLAMNRYPLEAIVRALGADAKRTLPALLQLDEMRVVLPLYVVQPLHYLADQSRTTVNELLRELLHDYVESLRSPDLEKAIPGLLEAMFFPSTPPGK
jgi:hypothetical protein